MFKVIFKYQYKNNVFSHLFTLLGINENKSVNFLFDFIGYLIILLPIIGVGSENVLQYGNLSIFNFPLLFFLIIIIFPIIKLTVVNVYFNNFIKVIKIYKKNNFYKLFESSKIFLLGSPFIVSSIILISAVFFFYIYDFLNVYNLLLMLFTIALITITILS